MSDEERAAEIVRQIRKGARDRMRLVDDDVTAVLLAFEHADVFEMEA